MPKRSRLTKEDKERVRCYIIERKRCTSEDICKDLGLEWRPLSGALQELHCKGKIASIDKTKNWANIWGAP